MKFNIFKTEDEAYADQKTQETPGQNVFIGYGESNYKFEVWQDPKGYFVDENGAMIPNHDLEMAGFSTQPVWEAK